MPFHFTTPLLRESENKIPPPPFFWSLFPLLLVEKKQKLDCSALPPISTLVVYAHYVLAFTMHPSFPSPPFTVTWLLLMTRLTPAYRIKLISTKQGLVGFGGVKRRGVAEGVQQQGVRRKEEDTI